MRASEGKKHSELKFYVCRALAELGIDFWCEAQLVNGKRPDIIVPNNSWAIEIQCSESDESIEVKKSEYLGLKIIPIKSLSDITKFFGDSK